MPSYRVTIVNEHFSQDAQLDAPDPNRAWQNALQSAITIGGEQVAYGSPFSGAVVTLEDDEKQLARYVVSVGASPLKDGVTF